jgi:hypothetical protein
MAQLSRTGVSLEDDLLKEFDRLIAKRGYANRFCRRWLVRTSPWSAH